MDFWAMVKLINDQYPQLMPIIQQPGIFAAVSQAIQENWPQARLQAAIENTEYYKNTAKEIRNYDILSATDPAAAHTRQDTVQHQVDDLMSQLGVKLSTAGGLASPYVQFLHLATAMGWSQDEVRYQMLLRTQYAGYDAKGGGELATDAASIKGMARDYGVTLSDSATVGWARQLAQGAVTSDGIKGYLIEQAKSLFPQLAGALDQGITVAQYTDPYKQVAVQELGINPETFDLTQPKWQAALAQTDPKTGGRVPLNLSEWQVKLRTDPTYGYDTTVQARTQVGQLATQIAQKMGAV